MKYIRKTAILLALVMMVASCKKEEVTEYGDVGEITITTVGAMEVIPATVTFTAEAENAGYFIWDFGYSKDTDPGDGDDNPLPMGGIGDEIEFTFEHRGTYTIRVTAANAGGSSSEKEMSVSFFTLEDDLEVDIVDNKNLDITIDACDPDLSLDFEVGFNVTDQNSIIDLLTVVRDYNSPLYGDYTVTDTIDGVVASYTYSTQADLLASFGIEDEVLLGDGDALAYRIYATGNGVKQLLGEVTGTAALTVLEAETLPLGRWLATNDDTGFSKEIVIERPSPYRSVDDGRYWLSDFGLDWSSWYDNWYTTEIRLVCPAAGETAYAIEMVGLGLDTGETRTDTDRFGATVTKSVRIMPYIYSGTATGYYDPATETITFEAVPLTDAWWGADNHTVSLTFTYLGAAI